MGTMAYFVVVNVQGPAWVDSRSMRDQALWTEHAAFINALIRGGFVVLGGPLGDGRPHRALLIISSESESTVRARLREDPWVQAGILRIGTVEPWAIIASDDRLDPVLAEISRSGLSG